MQNTYALDYRKPNNSVFICKPLLTWRTTSKLLAISVSIIVLSTVVSEVAFGAPLTNTSVNPSSTIGLKGTQYVIITNVATAGTVGKILVTFPIGTTLTSLSNFAIVTRNDMIVPGTTATVNTAGTTMEFDLTNPTAMNPGDKLFLFIEKVRNPTIVGSVTDSLTVTTQDAIGNTIDGPTSANFGLQDTAGPAGPTGPSPLDANNGLTMSGNITSTAAQEFKISAPPGIPICIGSC